MISWVLVALLGWLAGMLINYTSDVMPTRRRLAGPICLSCEYPFPLINYLFWPRRCPQCGRGRTWRSWVVELIAILATLWMWQNPPTRIGFAAGFALLIYFGIVVVIDIEHRLILHWVSLFGAILSLAIGIYVRGWQGTLLGGLAGLGIMFSLYFLGILFVRFINRRRMRTPEGEALGFGDVILGGVLGLLLGWPAIVLGLVMAFLLGGIFSLLYLVAMVLFGRYRSFSAIPYGPFLIAGAAGLIFFSRWVLSVLGQ